MAESIKKEANDKNGDSETSLQVLNRTLLSLFLLKFQKKSFSLKERKGFFFEIILIKFKNYHQQTVLSAANILLTSTS